METLESSRVCRLCGQHSGICINIFDKNETHVKKINAVLPILVHEMDMLPKQMCHRCSYKLEEFHKFYSDCLKTDMNLKSQLSWMRKREVKEHIRVPMVQIENVKIKSEPPDYDIYELDPIVENVNYISSMSSMTFPMNSVRNNNEVNSRRINNINERLTCDKSFADCSHCEYNYDNNSSTNEAALSRNCTDIKSKRDVKRDSSCSTDLGSSSRLNTLQNSQANGISKDVHKRKTRYFKRGNGINIHNILNTDEVKEIKIKTEKPDDIEIRSLRPRKKSVDYLCTKRKKCTLIINPANVSRSLDAKRKSTAKQILDTVVNRTVVDNIKKEPLEEAQTRTLRPRRFLVNYLGSKRKELSCARTEPQNISKSQKVRAKRYKSSNSSESAPNFGSGKRLSGLISNPNQFKVKEEIISDDETLNVVGNDEVRCNDIAASCVKNLSNLFDGKTKPAIKIEDDIEESLSDPDWVTSAVGSRSTRGSKSLAKLTSKFKSKKLTAKRISDTNCSPRNLRSQDLRLRNGKVKKSESDQQISMKSLKKKFLDFITTGQKFRRNLPSKIEDNVNAIKVVPTGLKTSSNIKQFCEKCCTSFMNKELYMLHACYYD